MEACALNIENFVGESVKEFRNLDFRLTKIEATLPHLATKAGLKVEISGLKEDMAKMEARFIKWFVGSVIAIGALIVTSAGIIPAILQQLL